MMLLLSIVLSLNATPPFISWSVGVERLAVIVIVLLMGVGRGRGMGLLMLR